MAQSWTGLRRPCSAAARSGLGANARRLADALTGAGYQLDPPLKLRSPPRVVH